MKKRTNKIIKFDDDGGEYESEEIKLADVINTPEKWYNQINADPVDMKPVDDTVLIQLKDEAKKCLDADVAAFNIKNVNTNSDFRWMKSIMSKGTVTDKVAANTVLIQNNPVCNLSTIQTMVSMVKAGKKRECIAIMDTLTELFLSDLLRPNQKLLLFHERPLSELDKISSGNHTTRKKYLSYWYFEDQLKETYTTYVRALSTAAHDTVESNKEKAITAMYKLLAGNPEQEKNLLSYLVNKLGDPNQKVASKTMYCLTQLLHKHANMQAVVLVEIEKILFRSNVTAKTQYYCLCFMSQFYMCHQASDVARKLIETYFSFFKSCIKKGDVDSRMMSVLLMGVNRAYPYAKLEMSKMSEHIDTMYKVVHVANFNVSLHALNLLYQVSHCSDNINDRFYSALYKKLLDTNLTATSQQAILLNLLFKSILQDSKTERIRCFLKRLLQICSVVQPNFACGVLYTISQILKRKSEARSVVFHESAKNEEGPEIKPEPIENDEVNNDGPIDEVTDVKEVVEIKEDANDNEEKVNISAIPVNKNRVRDCYDPFSRNPLYAGGDFCVFVELEYLVNHFHPTVSLFAKNILNGESIKYSGDSLKDFSLIRFLERFVFKNPKGAEEVRKLKPVLPTSFSRRKHYRPEGLKALNVNSDEYLRNDAKNIPVDELFLHTYLFNKYRQRPKTDEDEDSDADSVASDEFEEVLNKMSGFGGDTVEDEDVDFMADVEEHKNSEKGKKKLKPKEDDDDDDESDEEGSENEDLSDNELEENFSDLEDDDIDNDLMENSDDEVSDLEFGDSDDEIAKPNVKKGKKFNKKSDKKAIVEKLKKSSLFANAEEFSALLEETGSSKIAPGSSSAVLNKDSSGVKQLAWEDKRNRWLGPNNKGGKNKGGFNKNKSFEKRKRKQNTVEKSGMIKKHKK